MAFILAECKYRRKVEEREVNQSCLTWKGPLREGMSPNSVREFKQKLEGDNEISKGFFCGAERCDR